MMQRTLGCCYYPEHWPEEIWPKDARRMVEAGLTWVRIGEFAWSRLEPQPDQFDWGWLDRAITVLGDAGLKVVLGTPTATPPRWMLTRHPDMLAVNAAGHPRGFGSRRHYCFSHPGYFEESRRITRLFAERYGRNPHVAAWQTDNEYGCHDTILSYSDAARDAFRDWCAQRYQSPDALNKAWGNVFWSMDYASFDEIGLPNLTVTEPNPAHVMAFRRFSSDQVVRFNRAQTEILRRFSDAPVAHNYMGRVTEFDHYKVGADLDIASWDSYPLGFLEDRVGRPVEDQRAFARQGDPDFQAFHHDLYRAVASRAPGVERPPRSCSEAIAQTSPRSSSEAVAQTNQRSSSEAVAQTNQRSCSEAVAQTNQRSSSEAVAQSNQRSSSEAVAQSNPNYGAGAHPRLWVMEQQPGPVNWAPYNPAPLPGMVRLWTWEAFAHGAEAVLYFRWRQAPMAQEQMHAGLLRPDSVDAPGLEEAREVAAELQQASHVAPVQAPVGLIFDYDAEWMWQTQPHGAGSSYFGLVFETYRALRRAGLDVDILPPDPDCLHGYALILAPGLMHLSGEMKQALTDSGAQVCLGPRSAARDVDFNIPLPLPPAMPGLDLTVTRVESLRPDMPRPLSGGGAAVRYIDEVTAEGEHPPDVLLETEEGAPILLRQHSLWYLAGWLDDHGFDRLIAALAEAADLPVMCLPEGLRCRCTGTERIWFNYTATAQSHAGRTLQPAGVLREALNTD